MTHSFTTPPESAWMALERGDYKKIKRSASNLSLSNWIPDSDSKFSAERKVIIGVLFVALGVLHIITAWHWNRRGLCALGAGVAGLFVGACQLGWGVEQQAHGGAWYGSNSKKWSLKSNRKHTSTLALAALAMYLLVGLLIHGLSPDPFFHVFPGQCPPNKQLGCSRIADNNEHRNLGAAPLKLQASLEVVHTMVQAWVRQQPGAVVLNDVISASPSRPDSFIHARFASAFFGFADDVLISVRCENYMAVLEVQGQLRAGVSDFDVNQNRNLQFFNHVQRQVAEHKLPAGTCQHAHPLLIKLDALHGIQVTPEM